MAWPIMAGPFLKSWPASPNSELTRMNRLAVAATARGPCQRDRCSSGARKIPPPMPTSPARKPSGGATSGIQRAKRVGSPARASASGISMVRLVRTRLAPSSVRKVSRPIGTRPPRKLAGAETPTSSSAPRQGVIPARAKRMLPPVTTTMLQARLISGSSR